MPLNYIGGDPNKPKGHAVFLFTLNGIPHGFYAGAVPFDLPGAGEAGILYASRDSKFSMPESRIVPGFASPLTRLTGDELERLRKVATYRGDDVVDLGQLTGGWVHEILHDAIEQYTDAYTRALKTMKLL